MNSFFENLKRNGATYSVYLTVASLCFVYCFIFYPFNIGMGQDFALLKELGESLRETKFENVNYFSTGFGIQSTLGVLISFTGFYGYKFTFGLLYLSLLASLHLVLKRLDRLNPYAVSFLFFLSIPIFVYGDLSILTGAVLGVYMLARSINVSRFGSIELIVFALLAHIFPMLAMVVFPIVLIQGLTKSSSEGESAIAGTIASLLPGLVLVSIWLAKAVIYTNTYELAFNASRVVDSIIPLLTFPFIGSEFDNLRVLLPITLLALPFVSGYSITRKKANYIIVLYFLGLITFLPRGIEGYFQTPVELRVLLLGSWVVVLERQREYAIPMWLVPVTCIMFMYSYVTSSIDYNKEVGTAYKTISQIESAERVYAQVVESEGTGVYFSSKGVAELSVSVQNSGIELYRPFWVDSPLKEGKDGWRYEMNNNFPWLNRVTSSQFDHYLLRNCDKYKHELLGENEKAANGCWRLYSVEQ